VVKFGKISREITVANARSNSPTTQADRCHTKRDYDNVTIASQPNSTRSSIPHVVQFSPGWLELLLPLLASQKFSEYRSDHDGREAGSSMVDKSQVSRRAA
jgi:hypothetical protein